jgi:hypothetical protein
MPEYGKCAKCGNAIDPETGYSNRLDVKERSCLPCQFPDSVRQGVHPVALAAEAQPIIRQKVSTGFNFGAGPVRRLGISISELLRRSRVAQEAHEAGKAIQRTRR